MVDDERLIYTALSQTAILTILVNHLIARGAVDREKLIVELYDLLARTGSDPAANTRQGPIKHLISNLENDLGV